MPSAEERDKLRARVLRAFYDENERDQTFPAASPAIASAISTNLAEVNKAIRYMAEHGLIIITHEYGEGNSPDRVLMAKITADGIDIVERPDLTGRDMVGPDLVRAIIVVNTQHIDTVNQQVIGGDNSGTMSNG